MNKKSTLLYIVLFLFFILPAQAQMTQFTVYGQVFDTDNTPVNGVTVSLSVSGGTISTITTTAVLTNGTIVNGYYYLDLANLPVSVSAGTSMTLTATTSGKSSSQTVARAATEPQRVDLYLSSIPVLVFAVTPNSRNAQIGTPLTIFMSVINGGTVTATNVSIAQASSLPVTVSYQQWNGTAFIGSPNTPVNIAPGGTANFVLTITATSAFSTSSLTFNVSGTNAAAGPISGVNTLTISASAVQLPDVIMISTNLNISTPVNTPTFFAVATTNVGASATGVSLVVSVPSSITGLAYQVNQTNPATGAIIGPATGLTINAGDQPTFAVFMTPTQPIAFDPTNNRIMLRLVDGTGAVIGAQSVAISTT